MTFSLPLPSFDAKVKLHGDLVKASQRAERVASQVPLADVYFVTGRRRIRKALEEDGVDTEIDKLVDELLRGRGAAET